MLKFTKEQQQKFRELLHIKELAGDNETRLLKKAQLYTKLFSLIAGIKMIAVGNSVAMNNAHQDSDIDLFVICEKHMMWMVRINLTILLTLLGQRKTARKHAGKFCLSFFMTDENLSLQDISIPNDIYLYHWILTLQPLLSRGETYEKFITSNSAWCDFSEYQNIIQENKKYCVDTSNQWFYRGCFIDRFFDKILKTIFLPRTLRKYKQLGEPEGVVISENMLKFHDQDKRKQIRDVIIVH